ncbi:MAG TPA: MFS transporter [Anaerolineae bacterium]|nr:MFS transporter [Anaerolineae bacterium]HQI85830.1 MFS transporter [Anaerolineae bacterium]
MEPTTKKSPWPLILLLVVQLLGGIMLMPARNFISIYLNEVIEYPVRQVAQVMAWGQVVGMAASLVGGSLSDRWGHKWLLVLGVGGVAVSSLLYVFRAPWLVAVLWSLGSAGLGFSTLSSQGYLTLAAGAGALGVFSALYNWGYTIGAAVGNPLAAVVLGADNFAALGLALAGFGVLTTLTAGLLPPLRPQARAKGVAPAPSGYGTLLRRPPIVLLGLLRFLPTCYYGITTLLPLLIKQQGGSNAAVAWYAALSSVFASLTQLLAGRLADRKGVRLPTQIAFGVILLAIGGTILTARSVWGLYIFGALGVGAAWALSTLLPGMVTVAAEPEVHGRVFGMLHLLWTGAMILGTLLGGTLLEIDVRLPFAVVGVLNVIALALTTRFFRMKEPHPS